MADETTSAAGSAPAPADSGSASSDSPSGGADPRPSYVSAESFFSDKPSADAPATDPQADQSLADDGQPAPTDRPADPLKSLLALPGITPELKQHVEHLHRQAGRAAAEAKFANDNYKSADAWQRVASRLYERLASSGAGVQDLDGLFGDDEGGGGEDQASDSDFDLQSPVDYVLSATDDKWHAQLLDASEEADRLAALAADLDAADNKAGAEAARKQARGIRLRIQKALVETPIYGAANIARSVHSDLHGRFGKLSSRIEDGSAAATNDAIAGEAVASAYQMLDDSGRQRYADMFEPGKRQFSARGRQLVPAMMELAAQHGLDPRDESAWSMLYTAASSKFPATKSAPSTPTRGGDPSAIVETGAPAVGSPVPSPSGDSALEDPAARTARFNRRAFA